MNAGTRMWLWTRFGVVGGSLVTLVAATMPWLRDVRPMQVPVGFVVGSIPDSGITGSGFFSSLGLPLVLAAIGGLLGGLYGRRLLSWACGVAAFAIWAIFYLQVMYLIGSLDRFDYGGTVALFGVAITAASALIEPPPLGYAPRLPVWRASPWVE